MATPPRFWTANHIFAGVGLVESSQTAGNPAEALYDAQRSFYWQTEVGWTITDNNDKLDFNRGGVKVATLAHGTYASGASLAAQVVAALEAADPTPVWSCDYDVSAADKFTILQGSTFSLLCLTGANKFRSVFRSLGFSEAADLTGANNYASSTIVFQSQHFLEITLSTEQAAEGVTAIALLDHNFDGLQVGCVMSVQSNATLSWTAPTSQLTGGNGQLGVRGYISSSTHRFWRLKVDDVANPSGYFRIGILWLGNYLTSPYCFSDNQSRKARDFSSVMTAIPGQHSANFRRRRKEMSLEVMEVPDASAEVTLRAFFEDINIGQDFILDLDPSLVATLPSAGFLYGFMPDTEGESFVPYDYWTFGFPFCEAL